LFPTKHTCTPGNLIAGILFGIVGLYVMKVAKKDVNLTGLGLGLTLMIYPYFVTNVLLNWGIGIVLSFFAIQALRNS